MFEAFANSIMEWSSILGLTVIVSSVVYTAYRLVSRLAKKEE